ncbi:OmpH family outer membrane protein [Gynuella sp.]|uniref:OmpH family outer membrane protein n=1 Tax=Gynuella sp. TaxID=2969146 RepID=UPI003D11BB82
MIRNLFAVLLLSLSTLAMAEAKIAILDQNMALFGSEAAKSETEKLKSEYGSDEQRIKKLEAEVNELKTKLETDAVILEAAEQDKIKQTIQERLAERSSLIDKLKQIQNQRQNQFIREYQPVMAKAVKAIVEQQSIDVVVEASSVIYVNEALNITQQVQDEFNKLVKEGK